MNTNLIAVMIANTVMQCCLIVCITKAAFYFENPKLLFLYLLLTVTGYSYRTSKDDDEKETECGANRS